MAPKGPEGRQAERGSSQPERQRNNPEVHKGARGARANDFAAKIVETVNPAQKMADAIVARMAKKPEDLAKYQPRLRASSEDTSNRDEIDQDVKDKDGNYIKRSPENAEFSKLFAEVQNLAAKAERENSPLLHGFISRKGEKQIGVNWHNGGEGAPGFYLKYGNEAVDNGSYYDYHLDNEGNLSGREYYPENDETTPAQRKQIYTKEIAVLKKVVEILKRGFKFPEPRYMVVKTTAETKKNIGVNVRDGDRKEEYQRGTILPNILVKVIYTSPETGFCYVIAKANDGSARTVEGFVEGKVLEPYNAAKFHPEVSPIKKAVPLNNAEVNNNGGLNLRNSNKVIIGKVPPETAMTVLALESTGGKSRALVQFKDPSRRGKLTTGFVAAELLSVVE